MPQMESRKITKILMLSLFAGVFFVSCDKLARHSGSQGDMNWNLFRGNSGLSGYTDLSLPDKPVVQWTYKAGVRTVSSPVVEEGTTYWCDKRGLISGVDINGQLCFSYNLNTAVEATPLIHDSILYIGRIDGYLTAISLAKKDTLWNYETQGQISASPNITVFKNQMAIVAGSYDNYMYCVNAANGALINRFESGYYLNGAAALWNNYVLFGGCDAWLRIINCETGEATDSLKTEAYIPCSPAVMGNFCYVGDYNGNIYELMLENGKISRHKKVTGVNNDNGSFVSVPAISGENICFFSGDRNLISANRRAGEINWKFMLKGHVGESAPVICQDEIIVCTKTGIVSILDAGSGKQIWEYDTGEPIVASPAVIKDHFLILTTRGTLFCFGQ
jgi:eukaryotic-like serine/threonine-protein kinase